ncbi:PEP-CTERM sorting domain-containing protein [Massilia sp. LjRoot122]|uniref:PEP-CTERM sorting domain-containing protein n=1 Tax=Massilia sp. LjRoot122 TaxID=3342257 RepID=UPI003ED0BDAA
MFFRLASLVTVVVVLFPSFAHATILSASSSGTIENGIDEVGLFGAKGTSLAGKNYFLELRFDRSLNTDFIATANNLGNGSQGKAPVTLTAIVDGATYSRVITNGIGYQAIYYGLSTADHTNYGTTPNHVFDGFSASIDTPMSYGLDYFSSNLSYGSQGRSFTGAYSDVSKQFNVLTTSSILDWSRASFNFTSNMRGESSDGRTYFYAPNATSFSFNAAEDAPSVPEPDTLALFGLSLASLIVGRRVRNLPTKHTNFAKK